MKMNRYYHLVFYNTFLVVVSLVSLGQSEIKPCCHVLKLSANVDGNAFEIQKQGWGVYIQNPLKSLNNEAAFIKAVAGSLKSWSIMKDKRYGWKIYDEIPINTKHLKFPKNYKGQIRTHCLEKCPEDCRNENNWEYYNEDSDDENNMWYKDGSIKLECEGLEVTGDVIEALDSLPPRDQQVPPEQNNEIDNMPPWNRIITKGSTDGSTNQTKRKSVYTVPDEEAIQNDDASKVASMKFNYIAIGAIGGFIVLVAGAILLFKLRKPNDSSSQETIDANRRLKSLDSFDQKPDIIPDNSKILRKNKSKVEYIETESQMHSLAQFNRISDIPLQV